MSISTLLNERCQGTCEMCNQHQASVEFTVSPKSDDSINHQVALCELCSKSINDDSSSYHWRCIEGSMWNPNLAVQALSYRLLNLFKEEDWAAQLINSFDIDEDTREWAMSSYVVSPVHKDAFGNLLENGDTVVLTQALNVKGTSFSASKGTVVKRIKLVAENTDQIEGKINDQTIVILTKFTKKA